MSAQDRPRPFPLIDSDPHAARVVRYFRASDYGLWAGAMLAGPTLLNLYERVDPSKYRHGLGPATRLTGFLGFCAGFMLAYQSSTFRFWGFKENAAEVARDKEELSAKVSAGNALYGDSDMSPYLQGVAARNSTWSQLKLHAMPWFNIVNHNSHGVDVSKYGAETSQQQRPS